MNLNSRQSLVARLRRGRKARQQFVESNLNKGIAFQIRAIRDRLGWSQERLAEEVDMNQNAVSRLESSDYGKQTLTTLKRLAGALDVGLVVRFVPFSEMADWVSGTPYLNLGLRPEALAVPNFSSEEAGGIFDAPPRPHRRASFSEQGLTASSAPVNLDFPTRTLSPVRVPVIQGRTFLRPAPLGIMSSLHQPVSESAILEVLKGIHLASAQPRREIQIPRFVPSTSNFGVLINDLRKLA